MGHVYLSFDLQNASHNFFIRIKIANRECQYTKYIKEKLACCKNIYFTYLYIKIQSLTKRNFYINGGIIYHLKKNVYKKYYVNRGINVFFSFKS